jgi:hypothetical protein
LDNEHTAHIADVYNWHMHLPAAADICEAGFPAGKRVDGGGAPILLPTPATGGLYLAAKVRNSSA